MQQGTKEYYQKEAKKILSCDMQDYFNQWSMYQLLVNAKQEIGFEDREFRDWSMKLSTYTHKMAQYMTAQTGKADFWELYWNLLLLEAPYRVDSFMRYIERDDQPEKRFYEPRAEKMKPIIEAYQQVYDGDLDFLSVSQPKRTGKCLCVDEKVCTPTGFKRIGDIKVGDYVISANGNPTKVLGVYPQKEKHRVYEIEFTESGKSKQKTIIECCKDHLWEVSTEDSRYKKKSNRVMTTEELFEGTIKRGADSHNNYAVDYVKPVQFQSQKVPIDPWFLGILIGDGCLRSGDIRASNCEPDILERVKNIAKKYGAEIKQVDEKNDYRLPYGDIAKRLRELGLIDKKSEEKFIPDCYLLNSVEVRAELLRGLCDSDGYAEKGGIEYCTSSKRLSENVQFLVKSLGGKVSVDCQKAHYTKNGEKIDALDKYRLYINFPRDGICPVSSEKHLKKYNPKRNKLYHFINDIRKTNRFEDMVCIEVEDESSLYAVSENFILTHNTQGALRLGLQFSGRRPDRAMLAVGSGQSLAGSFFGGMLTIITRPKGTPNRFFEIFPDAQMKNGEPFKTKADDMTIDFQTKKTFATVTCRSIDGKIVGCTEATNLLYLDDTVANHEEAMNRSRLEFLCEKVAGDVLGRRIEGTPIIIQGTKYSLYDPITFLQNKAEEMGWRWKEVAIPALDPITDESNFTVFIDGRWRFTTEFYRNERKLVTEEVWEAEFQQNPFEAKGRMFPEKELNRYIELPVNIDPDAVVAVCDTAESGSDSTSMPVAYIYGDEIYIEDVVFDSSPSNITKPQCAKMLVKHNVSTATFESNNAGTYFARDVDEEVKKLGGICSIRTKRTISNKLTRIEYASDNIKKHFWFKDKSKYEPNSQYGRFMKEVTTMTRSGKVPHDDAPDSLSLLENELRGAIFEKHETRVMKSPI